MTLVLIFFTTYFSAYGGKWLDAKGGGPHSVEDIGEAYVQQWADKRMIMMIKTDTTNLHF